MSAGNVAFLVMAIFAFATFMVVLGSVAVYVRFAPRHRDDHRSRPNLD